MKIYASYAKPLLDIIGGALLSLLSGPLILGLCLLIRLESKGSPIFIQRRVGLHTKLFPIFKLRTMVNDAETQGPGFTSQNDARITRLGSFLRKTSLDELPQFWNMTLGHMSLIGPRPGLPREKAAYPSEEVYARRHAIRPGITGLTQATLRSSATLEQAIVSDLYYVNNCSLPLDIRIIWKTVKVVLRMKGTN